MVPHVVFLALTTSTYFYCALMDRRKQKSVAKFQKWKASGDSDIPVVEVTAPDGSRSLWAAAVAPENAVAVVAMLVPANHVAKLSRRRLTLSRKSDELQPGEVRRVRL
jgi:hypothetical protein